MSVPKENKLFVRDEIANQKISTLVIFQDKIFTTCQISNQFFLQRVRFQNKIFTTCQILNQKFYNVSDFVLNEFFKNQILHKNVHSKNHVLTEFTPYNGGILKFLCIFKKYDSDAKNTFEK